MDGDEKGARAKKSLKGQNWLLFFFFLLYLYILLFLQEIPGFMDAEEKNFFQISCQPFSISLQNIPLYPQYG